MSDSQMDVPKEVKDVVHTAKAQPRNDDSFQHQELQEEKMQDHGFLDRLGQQLFDWLSKVDSRKATENVKALRLEFPELTPDKLIEQLIRRKCQYTAKIGAATAASGSIPVLGTALSLTVGMILDLGAVITAQAELVLEIAEVYEIKLNPQQKRETILVVLGLGTGLQRFSSRMSNRFLQNLVQRYGQRWFSHVIPVAGIAAAAGINAVSTYIIGQRAQAYFSGGAEAMGDWKSSLRALSGLDEKKIGHWLSNGGQEAQKTLWGISSGICQQVKSLFGTNTSSTPQTNRPAQSDQHSEKEADLA